MNTKIIIDAFLSQNRTLKKGRKTKKMESLELTRFFSIALLLLLWCLSSSLAQQQYEENPTIRTMEDFSGYPIHESGQFGSTNLASSLSVDAQGLQKQVFTSKGVWFECVSSINRWFVKRVFSGTNKVWGFDINGCFFVLV